MPRDNFWKHVKLQALCPYPTMTSVCNFQQKGHSLTYHDQLPSHIQKRKHWYNTYFVLFCLVLGSNLAVLKGCSQCIAPRGAPKTMTGINLNPTPSPTPGLPCPEGKACILWVLSQFHDKDNWLTDNIPISLISLVISLTRPPPFYSGPGSDLSALSGHISLVPFSNSNSVTSVCCS